MASKELEAIAVVLHVGSSQKSKISLEENDKDFLEKAKDCILKILLRKIFSESKDVLSVIVAGSQNTENDLSESGDYQNIEVLSPFIIASWDLIDAVMKLQQTDIYVNWLDAMVVGIQCLRDKIEEIADYTKLKNNLTKKKLVLLSSFIEDVSDEQYDSVVEALKDMGVELVVIGPNNLKIGGDSSDSTTAFDSDKRLTQSQQLILRIFNQVADKGTLCSCDDALEQLKFFVNKKTRRMPWNVNMSIGPDIAIPISGFKMLNNNQQPFKWKLRSSTNNEDVKSHVSFFVEENEVEREDIISGYLFGSKIVPFSADDEEASKYQSGEKGLSVLFTVLEDEVPKYLLMGESPYYVTGRKNDLVAQLAISAFVKALSESNTVAIARKVYAYNSSVNIGVLYPKPDASPSALIFIQLPFKNEIQKFWFPSLDNVSINDEQLGAVNKLIDSMDLSQFEDDDDPYHPERLYDPYEQYQFHCISSRAFKDEQVSLRNSGMEIPEFIQELLLPLPEIMERSKNALEEIKELFPLEVINKTTSVNPVNDESSSNKVKEEEKEENDNLEIDKNDDFLGNGNFNEYFLSTIRVVGTVNPESDFTKLLAKGQKFEKVCEQMQKVIIDLLRRADNLDMLNKPLLCTELMRKSCIERKQSGFYNDWVKKLKEIVTDIKQQDFWNKVIEGNLGLITTGEESNSDISTDTAEQFLNYNTNVKSLVNDEEMDIDNLLDDL